jgi:hypothetical protein
MTEPYFHRPFLGLNFPREEQWRKSEQIPMESASLYLGTTIAFNKEDEAKHGKHILDSMKENILDQTTPRSCMLSRRPSYLGSISG